MIIIRTKIPRYHLNCIIYYASSDTFISYLCNGRSRLVLNIEQAHRRPFSFLLRFIPSQLTELSLKTLLNYFSRFMVYYFSNLFFILTRIFSFVKYFNPQGTFGKFFSHLQGEVLQTPLFFHFCHKPFCSFGQNIFHQYQFF